MSTDQGMLLEPDRFMAVFEAHRRRLVDTWTSFGPDDWGHASRNADWTVHQTVRHVADAMERGAAKVRGEADAGSLDGFDPRATPDRWLAASATESPAETIRRYDSAAARMADGFERRWGDDSFDEVVYGRAHWTVNPAHIVWDSWLHERDVALPLGLEPASSGDEERIVGLYGLLISLLPSRMMEQTVSTAVELVGLTAGAGAIELRCEGGTIGVAEVTDAAVVASGALRESIDALAGRGCSVEQALPGAPAELGYFAAFLSG